MYNHSVLKLLSKLISWQFFSWFFFILHKHRTIFKIRKLNVDTMLLAVVNHAAINMGVQIPVQVPAFTPLGMSPKVVLLNPVVILFSVFWWLIHSFESSLFPSHLTFEHDYLQQYFVTFYFYIISNFPKSCKNNVTNSDISFSQIHHLFSFCHICYSLYRELCMCMDVCVHVWMYVHVSVCVSMYTCVCVESPRYDASLPPNNSTWAACGKDVHFHKHRTIIKIRKLNTDKMLLSNSKSIFKFCSLSTLAGTLGG